MNQYVKQYQKANIETASREQILIMLYEGAIQYLNKAKIAMAQKDIAMTHQNLIGAQNIIQEFINSLDREIAPQLAENLVSLYEYFIRRLIQANVKRQMEPIDEVLKYLKNLKETWEKAIILAQQEANENIDDDDDLDDAIDDDEEDDLDEDDDEEEI